MNKPNSGNITSEALSTFADPASIDTGAVTSSLNELLRRRLSQSLPMMPVAEPEPASQPFGLAECLTAGVEEMLSSQPLNRAVLDQKLELLFDRLHDLYLKADIDPAARKRQFISPNGLVMSPDHCVTTQKDSLRVRAFIRAADRAIAQIATQRQRPVHIAYPACGPFAPLLLPLIAYYRERGLYDENDLRITLIDMQQGAVASLQAIIHEMRISGFIHEIVCQDACNYQPSMPIDIVVLEAMQHGFSREGHLAMARHFASVMQPDGLFIPQKISLRAVLNTGQREFVEQWQDNQTSLCEANMQKAIVSGRIELGDILQITPDSLRDLPECNLDEHITLIECGEVVIPSLENRQGEQLLLICTRICVDDEETIGEYDSGITHPLADLQVCINFEPRDTKPGDLLVKSGDKLKFYYRLNGLPGFLATLADRSVEHE